MAAQDDVRREAGAMKNEARAIWSDAADVARSAASQQQQAAADGIGQFAGALREAARHGDGSRAAPSRLAESMADGLDRVSATIKQRDLGTLMRDVEDFARSQPLVFFGAAVAAGFFAMRFLKSSASDRPGDSALYGEGNSMAAAMARSADRPDTSSTSAGIGSTLSSSTASPPAGSGAAPVWPETDPTRQEPGPR